MQTRDLVTLPGAPQIRNLVFRRFRGASDYAQMLSAREAHTIGRGTEYANPPGEVA